MYFSLQTYALSSCKTQAFVKEYEKYHKYTLKNDSHAFENEYYYMMRDQINLLNNHLKELI
ncbi:hypothetical protein DF281_11140 [Kurthia zopfii]|uniref:hypothetical protein n=1 Tax=Kurthia zopfii TaxID=1650 RepID=UPI000D676FD2|nr:hypothetical protein [Kurthia zopfii]PWI21609.1 hypothetical protein DF281_11140 [Kurthia zopfii]